MLHLPRLAVGSIHSDVDPQPICWALLALMSARGHQVQHFHATSCFPRLEGAASATGGSSRHLDSWLMTPDACREAFAHGAARANLAIVEGRFASAYDRPWHGGQLDDLCDWLDLPRIAVIDVTNIEGCRLPARPRQADALLLDNVRDPCHFARLQTVLESLWQIPVLGALETLPPVRGALEALPRGTAPERELCQQLAASFLRYARLDRLQGLAARRAFPAVRPFIFRPRERAGAAKLTVAVAYDEAFRCYFADGLELLELCGATVVDFSPLRDEALPAGTDLVFLGCGHPERHAACLAENHCMRFAMREHLCAGRRIYAEGGGLAYLCEHIETPAGDRMPMVGALPAVAVANPNPAPPVPSTVTLARRCWLGRLGTQVRGYLSSNWMLEPTAGLDGLIGEAGHQRDLVGRYLAVGSRMHVNFLTQPDVLQSFLQPIAEPQASC
jgi:cobyrinic acid a,c-diamide synthase